MDDRRFDSLTRLLGSALSRRSVVPGFLAALVPTALVPEAAEGKQKRRRRVRSKGPCGDRGPVANRCRRHRDCCTGYCSKKAGRVYGRCRCRRRGQTCRKHRDCCAGKGPKRTLVCQNGRCQPPAPVLCSPNPCQDPLYCNPENEECCAGIGGPCDGPLDCCVNDGVENEFACINGECNFCAGDDATCTFDGQCCSERCKAGQCACEALGGSCGNDRHCCDFLSNTVTCASGRCCRDEFGACTEDADCCAGECQEGQCRIPG